MGYDVNIHIIYMNVKYYDDFRKGYKGYICIY
jgi:hypothetical protein